MSCSFIINCSKDTAVVKHNKSHRSVDLYSFTTAAGRAFLDSDSHHARKQRNLSARSNHAMNDAVFDPPTSGTPSEERIIVDCSNDRRQRQKPTAGQRRDRMSRRRWFAMK